MHTDESVHAEKFGALLEEGSYIYDPQEFHGPTLNYCTLFVAPLRGQATSLLLDEVTLRLVPALFGIALILMPLFFLGKLSTRSVFFCSTLIAFSPCFIYYSRYYIQESLLVFFTACFLGCLWNYHQSRKLPWIVLTGIFLGLMHATKETFVFSLFAAVAALFLCSRPVRSVKIKVFHVMTAVIAAGLTSMIFYSSFGANPQGILDSVSTYGVWLHRAGGQSVHVHPWYYYLNILTWIEFAEPLTWNEDGIVALACIGIVIAFLKRKQPDNRLAYFLAVYTLTLTVIYSVIPYKTPWSMMSFLYGMALVAAVAADALFANGFNRWGKVIIGVILFVYGLASPIVQSWLLNFEFSSDATNPYVYAHTGTDVFKMVDAVQNAVQASEEGTDTAVYVIAKDKNYWPFPWYLRGLRHVGYWDYVDDSVCQVPVILARAQEYQEVLGVLFTVPKPGQKNLYLPLFDEPLYLRPGVEWNGFVRKDLWDRMHQDTQLPVSKSSVMKPALESVSEEEDVENYLKFNHQAMTAAFSIWIQHPDKAYAAQAARAAFKEVDRLEGLLSHYIPNSDVSRINRLAPRGMAIVDEDTIKCLQVAQMAYRITYGAFNVTIGNLIAARKQESSDLAEQFLSKLTTPEMLELNDQEHSVKVLQEGVNVDLGGIGKGYAIDAIAGILTEWKITKALIHGGASSILALGPPEGKDGWPIILRNPEDESVIVRLELANEVMSCSGLQRGGHIINPFTGKPVTDRRACWVRLSQNAALADALSTAVMIMPVEKIQAVQEGLEDLSIMLLGADTTSPDAILRWGDWPQK